MAKPLLILACYVNSLFQTYFMSQQFVKAILEFDPEVDLPEEPKKEGNAYKEK